MEIRRAALADVPAIAAIHLAAFESDAEARLFEMLRDDGDIRLSLVAQQQGKLVGSNILSVKHVIADGRDVAAWAVGPIAVLPELQRRGIGSALMREAIEIAGKRDVQMLFLLGSVDYYSRFGFSADTAKPFTSPYAGVHFQALLLDKALKIPKSGKADYAAAFGKLG
ncbi:MAG: N-acetyltransferase [Sphingorhabdus sp.]